MPEHHEYKYVKLFVLTSLLYVAAFPTIVHFVDGGELFGAFFVIPLALIALGWGRQTGLVATTVGIAYSELVMNVEHFFIRHLANSPYWFTIVVAPVLVYLFVGFLVGTLGDTLRKQHKTEAALAEQERLHRSVLENLAIGVVSADKAEVIAFANPATEGIFGVQRKDLVGKNLREFLSEQDYEYVRAETTIGSTGEKSTYEIDIRQPSGEIRHVQVTAAPELDWLGNLVGTFRTMRDITDNYLSKTLLQRLLDSVPDFIYFKDLGGRFILTNKAHAHLAQLPDPAEMIGKTDFDFFSPQDSKAALEDEERIIRTREPIVDRQEKKTWPDRPETWLSTTKMPLFDHNGEFIGTFGISRDISERRRIEEKNLRLATMVESSNDAIIGVDLRFMVTSWNRGAVRIFGYTPEEMIGRPLAKVLAPETIAELPSLWGKLATEGHLQPLENLVSRKDGTQIYVSISLSPLLDQDTTLMGVVAISNDITSRRALQAQIIRSQRLESLATLASGIAHQFNNANAVIGGHLELIAGDTTLTASARLSIAEALKGVKRVVEITERLQGFTSAVTTDAENHRLEDAIPVLLQAFENRLKADGITLTTDWQKTPPVRVSLSLLNFLLASLLTNSIHALIDCHSPTIKIRTATAAEFSLLEVADNGCGIPPENLPRIFTPFFTTKGEWASSGSPQEKAKGIGLSLSVCQSSVAESGGWIEAESSPGGGTTFRVWLPTV